MRSAKSILLTMIVVVAGLSTSYASGIPMAAVSLDPDLPVIVVAKFGAGFNTTDAQNSAQFIAQALGLGGTITENVVFLGPSDLAGIGITDADILKQSVKAIHEQYGLLYIYLDVSKKASVSTQYGNNHKIDIWISNDSRVSQFATQLGLSGQFIYVLSLEYPELYPELLMQLLSTL